MSNKNRNTNENVTINNVDEKEEKNMSAAYDEEMDLRDEAQLTAEDQEKKELKENKKEEVSFYQRNKKKIWIAGGVALGLGAVGFGLWGVHNIGLGKTFLGRPKFKNSIVPQTPVMNIPAVDNNIVDFQEATNNLAAENSTVEVTNF